MNINYTRVPLKGKPGVPVSMNANFTGTAYLTERMKGYSICAQVTETVAALTGTLKLQASNNAFTDNTDLIANPAAVWVDIPSSSIAVAGTTSVFWNVTDVHYEAVRVVWTNTGGQGTFTPYYLAKG